MGTNSMETDSAGSDLMRSDSRSDSTESKSMGSDFTGSDSIGIESESMASDFTGSDLTGIESFGSNKTAPETRWSLFSEWHDQWATRASSLSFFRRSASDTSSTLAAVSEIFWRPLSFSCSFFSFAIWPRSRDL